MSVVSSSTAVLKSQSVLSTHGVNKPGHEAQITATISAAGVTRMGGVVAVFFHGHRLERNGQDPD
jgi:hypothetical protein